MQQQLWLVERFDWRRLYVPWELVERSFLVIISCHGFSTRRSSAAISSDIFAKRRTNHSHNITSSYTCLFWKSFSLAVEASLRDEPVAPQRSLNSWETFRNRNSLSDRPMSSSSIIAFETALHFFLRICFNCSPVWLSSLLCSCSCGSSLYSAAICASLLRSGVDSVNTGTVNFTCTKFV